MAIGCAQAEVLAKALDNLLRALRARIRPELLAQVAFRILEKVFRAARG